MKRSFDSRRSYGVATRRTLLFSLPMRLMLFTVTSLFLLGFGFVHHHYGLVQFTPGISIYNDTIVQRLSTDLSEPTAAAPPPPLALPRDPLDFDYFMNKFEKLRNLTTFQHLPLRFYIYENTNDTADELLNISSFDQMPRHLQHEEIFLHNVLIQRFRSSPLRTTDPNRADLFIIPVHINLVGIVHIGASRETSSHLQEVHTDALEAVVSSPLFQKLHGHRHVAIALNSRAFNVRWLGRYRQFKQLDRQFYSRMQNVTVVKDKDVMVCEELTQILQDRDQTDFLSLVKSMRGVTTSSFSVGLMGGLNLPFQHATRQKFDNASLHFFYHSRKLPSYNNSTIYRHWPMENMSWAALPPSSIGYDIDKDQWLHHFLDSKFCLVIRGDDPGSRSLARSVRVGCLPVLISDWMPLYISGLKTTLDMRDFSIVIPEQRFLNDAEGELQKVVDLPPDAIEDKLRALRYAQSVMLHDSPWFVEAFMKEAALSWKDRREF